MGAGNFERESGQFLHHTACPLEGCGSSDAGSVYLHEDGSHSYSCFSCKGYRHKIDKDSLAVVVAHKRGGRVLDMAEEMEKLEDISENLAAMDNAERHLRAEAYEFYGVKMELNEAGDRIDKIFYPTYRDGEHVGYRNRKRFQGWMDQVKKKPELEGVLKDFSGGIGDTKKGIMLFGQWLFPSGGSKIIITCGEEDCIATYHMCSLHTVFEGSYATVSVPSGEDVAWIKPHLGYLSSFKEICIIADQDTQGKEFQKELCKILPVGKVKIVKLPKGIKDPSQFWTECRTPEDHAAVSKQLYNAIWSAKKYSPVALKSLSEVWESYKEIGDEVLIPLPACFGKLQRNTGGLELGGIHGIVASTSVGKTALVGEILYNARLQTEYNIGICSAEDTVEEYLRTLISLHISKPLKEYSKADRDLEEEHDAMIFLQGKDGNRFTLLEHAGTADLETLLKNVEWLITAQDCKLIALDPVTLLVGSESSSLDDFMSDILKLAKRHMVAFLLVFHTRKTQSGHSAASQGAEITIEDIKSSGSGGQVCSSIMLLNRNKEHENETVKNTTTARWGKFRRKGSVTGQRDYIFYEAETGRLHPGVNPQEILEDDEGFDIHEEACGS